MPDQLYESAPMAYQRHVAICNICWAAQDDCPAGLCPRGRKLWEALRQTARTEEKTG